MPKAPRRIPLILVCVIAQAIAHALAAASAHADAPVIPAVEQIDVVHGRRLVLRVEVPDERVARRPVRLRTDDGARMDGRLYWLTARLVPESISGQDWLGRAVEWDAIPGPRARKMSKRPPGSWYLIAELPIDVFGQGLWIDNARYAINWLPDPWRLGLGAGGAVGHPEGMWDSPVPESALDSPPVARAIAQLTGDPLNRWRARLMLDGLRPAGALVRSLDESGPVRSFADLRADVRAELDGDDPGVAALEALAELTEARWQVALARLWLVDPDLCRAVRATAAGVADFDAVHVPVWDPSPLVVDDLLEDLLNPFVEDDIRALRARAWLATQPRGVVWVFDDAGRQDAFSGNLRPTIGVVSTPPDNAPALISVIGAGSPALAPAPARSLRVVGGAVPSRALPEGASPTTTPVPVRVGPWTTEVEVFDAVVGARPPGLTLGPLLEDWTLVAWRAGTALGALPPEGRRTTARLFRRARPTGGESRSGWVLLIECQTPERKAEDAPSDITDSVRVWLGPYGVPSAILRVDRTGAVTDELSQRAGATGLGGRTIDVAQTRSGWAFEIAIPPDAVGDDGVIRLGIDRTDAWRRHTAWPRRTLPWQDEPGRVAIDTATWDALPAP